jgi:translation initiation factor 1
MPNDRHKTVWSSDAGDLRKQGGHASCAVSLPPAQQTVFLHRESSGRKGKAVTLVKNLVLPAADLKALAKKLKAECGSGGTLKGGVIEIQGEHRERIAELLRALGYKVKAAGG